MTILLGFNDYGTLNRFDDNVMDCIKSFLSPTPREPFIEIHQQMNRLKFRPYKIFKFSKVVYRQYTYFSMESVTESFNSSNFGHDDKLNVPIRDDLLIPLRDDHLMRLFGCQDLDL